MNTPHPTALHPYLVVSSGLFTVVAFLHLLRLQREWEFQFGPVRISREVSLLTLAVTTALAAYGACLLLSDRD